MRIIYPLLFILIFFKMDGYSQINMDSLKQEFELKESDIDYLKSKVTNDVQNWPYLRDDSLGVILWKVFARSDLKEKVTIKTDSGDFTFDLFEEARRRTFGGFAGSYPFVESWEIEAEEKEIIKALEELKKSSPEIFPTDIENYSNGRSSYWYHIYFYYQDTDEIVYAWLRPSVDNQTTLALVGYSKPGKVEERKLINKDYWYQENKNQIQKFEKLIYHKILNELKK